VRVEVWELAWLAFSSLLSLFSLMLWVLALDEILPVEGIYKPPIATRVKTTSGFPNDNSIFFRHSSY
jgi:hypothetical protein